MALSLTAKEDKVSASGHGTGSFTSDAFTPADNSLLLIIVSHMRESETDTTLGTPNISGGSLEYTPFGTANLTPQYSTKLTAWTAPVTTGASMTITVDDANNYDIYTWAIAVIQFTGHDGATPLTGYISSTTGDIGDGAHSLTLTAAPTADDISLIIHGADASNHPQNPTWAANWNEVYDLGTPDGGFGLCVAQRTGSTSTTASVTDVYTAGGTFYKGSMFAVNVKAAASGPVNTDRQPTLGAAVLTGIAGRMDFGIIVPTEVDA